MKRKEKTLYITKNIKSGCGKTAKICTRLHNCTLVSKS